MSQTSEPLVEELVPAPEAEEVFLRWSRLPHCVFFDSARRDPKLGRYSFVAADPFEFYMCAGDDADAWQLLPERLALFPAQRMPDLPPFQGGAAGLWGYGLARSLEKLPPPRFDEFQTPGLAVGLYDVVAAFDHARNRAWIISHGWPETNPVPFYAHVVQFTAHCVASI